MILSHDQTGDGAAVLLLHSGVCDRRMWDPQWKALADAGYRVVRADFRGHGETPADFTRPHEASDDVRALLDSLGIERAALVGSSFGGRVALETAARYPERVTALALLCPGLPGHEPSAALRAFGAEEDALLEAGDVEAAVALNVEYWLGPQATPETRAAVADMQRHAFEVQLAAWYAAQAAKAADRPADAGHEAGEAQPAAAAEAADQASDETEAEAAPDLSRITVPCLAVGGSQDVADFREIAARLPRILPHARHVELDGAGHLPSLELPTQTTGLLLDFLGSEDCRRRATTGAPRN
ncbi:alpha/beta hydrolase [Streptomyces sp. NPDC046876]|uniref:alpha/beta fold hydrolase n=1 Tax=Streptomyces sp. NPDC046876 TaxID=3155616 RepID=UPI0033D404D0